MSGSNSPSTDAPAAHRAGPASGAEPALVVAVDGPAGSGKSTVARAVARQLGLRYLDTGSTYRAVTWLALQQGVDLRDPVAVAVLAGSADLEVGTDPREPTISVAGRRVDQEVRSDAVSAAVSAVSAVPAVRARLVAFQQAVLEREGGIVLEGRDTGAVVAPHAAVKVFLTAREEVRAQRRAGEQGAHDRDGVARVAAALEQRDRLDSARAVAPLAVPPGAVVIDTSGLAVEDVVRTVVGLVPAQPAAAPADTAAGPAGSAPPSAYSPLLFSVLQPIAALLARLALRVEVRGLEQVPRRGPILVAGNHSGLLDGPLVAIYSPRQLRILTKDEAFRGPLGWLLRRVGQVPVRRGRADRTALRACLQVLRDGQALGIFPEGTRGTGDLEQVRDGAAYLLLHVPDCPVVPVVCQGTRDALPPGSRRLRLRSRVSVVFGPAFVIDPPANPRARSAVAGVAEQVRVGLAEHLGLVRAGAR